MLYKKYHRDFVRRFKKRAKFKFFYKQRELICDVVVEPSINSTHIDIAVILLVNSNTTHPERLSLITLISSSGKLSIVNIEFIENAVQEIS